MSTKTEKGRSTFKLQDLQLLSKQWWVAATNSSGKVAKVNWKSGVMNDRIWATKEQEVAQSEDFFTWGFMIGKHGGEDLALAALARNEIEEREVKDMRGKTRTLYVVPSVKSTTAYNKLRQKSSYFSFSLD